MALSANLTVVHSALQERASQIRRPLAWALERGGIGLTEDHGLPLLAHAAHERDARGARSRASSFRHVCTALTSECYRALVRPEQALRLSNETTPQCVRTQRYTKQCFSMPKPSPGGSASPTCKHQHAAPRHRGCWALAHSIEVSKPETGAAAGVPISPSQDLIAASVIALYVLGHAQHVLWRACYHSVHY